MQYCFAPLEGLTDSIYRRLHHQYFPGVDCYYMPFFSPTIHRSLTPRESRELPMADSVPIHAIPQILTKNAEDFLWAVQQCADRGYSEVNLNLGCPSGTVVSKGKGGGMLADTDALNRFLDTVYASTSLPISLKTRLGVSDPAEFEHLLEIYNAYPVSLLIIHPRIRKEFYEAPVHTDWFAYAAAHSTNPLCYNGNLISRSDTQIITDQFPTVGSIMLGRGLIGDPGMLTPGGTTAAALEGFFDALLEAYTEAFGGSRNAMFRLKENWRYLLCRFDNADKFGKRLKKTTDVQEYKAITHEIFRSCSLHPQLQADWV